MSNRHSSNPIQDNKDNAFALDADSKPKRHQSLSPTADQDGGWIIRDTANQRQQSRVGGHTSMGDTSPRLSPSASQQTQQGRHQVDQVSQMLRNPFRTFLQQHRTRLSSDVSAVQTAAALQRRSTSRFPVEKNPVTQPGNDLPSSRKVDPEFCKSARKWYREKMLKPRLQSRTLAPAVSPVAPVLTNLSDQCEKSIANVVSHQHSTGALPRPAQGLEDGENTDAQVNVSRHPSLEVNALASQVADQNLTVSPITSDSLLRIPNKAQTVDSTAEEMLDSESRQLRNHLTVANFAANVAINSYRSGLQDAVRHQILQPAVPMQNVVDLLPQYATRTLIAEERQDYSQSSSTISGQNLPPLLQQSERSSASLRPEPFHVSSHVITDADTPMEDESMSLIQSSRGEENISGLVNTMESFSISSHANTTSTFSQPHIGMDSSSSPRLPNFGPSLEEVRARRLQAQAIMFDLSLKYSTCLRREGLNTGPIMVRFARAADEVRAMLDFMKAEGSDDGLRYSSLNLTMKWLETIEAVWKEHERRCWTELTNITDQYHEQLKHDMDYDTLHKLVSEYQKQRYSLLFTCSHHLDKILFEWIHSDDHLQNSKKLLRSDCVDIIDDSVRELQKLLQEWLMAFGRSKSDDIEPFDENTRVRLIA